MSLFDRLIVATLPLVPRVIVGKVASSYIAGETLDDAVRVVRGLNKRGFMGTVDVLGEFVRERAAAEESTKQYLALLDAITREKLDANISVKLTALGLEIESAFVRANLRKVFEAAAACGIFIRIDMEDSPHTTETLTLYDEMRREFRCGVAIQAYLRRSVEDVQRLIASGESNFRLCKGIYVEPEAIAYKGRDEVRGNFIKLLEVMVSGGAYVGIATHDEMLVKAAEDLIAQRGLARDRYEFQMLLGVRHDIRAGILSRGHRLRVYVPYGQAWYGYSTRRLKENPQLAGYVFRNLFRP